MSGLLPSEAFTGRWRERQQEKNRTRVEFPDWSLAIPEPQSGRLDFRRFPYQREPYEETADLPEVIVDKGTQVGFTTLMLRWVLWLADELGLTAMYVFPTDDLVKAFSDHRIKSVIQASDYLRSKIGPEDPQNKGMRKVGRGYVFFRGSMKETHLDSVPASGLVLDEYDTLNQKNIPVAERRVGAAERPMKRRIGVPTLTGTGIDRQYARSDKRRWLVRCEFCGERQRITWDNVRYEQVAPRTYEGWRVCVKCDRPINVADGEWVAEHPGREIRGYHVPRLIVPGLSRAQIGQMVSDRFSDKSEEVEAHYQRDMAEGFETPESRLSVDAIMSCRRAGVAFVESYTGFNPITMGIDQSAVRGLHVRVSEHLNDREKRVLFVGQVDAQVSANPDEPDTSALRRLAQLMRDFRVNMACIDAAPDGIFAKAFCAAHQGRAYMVTFNTSVEAKETLKLPPPDRPAEFRVTVKRTEYITTTLDLFRAQRNLLPGEQPLPVSQPDQQSYMEHLRNVVRKRLTDAAGRDYYGYDETGPIDFLMCELYDVVATDVLAYRLVEGAINLELNTGQIVQPEDPTPDLNDWDAKPWEGDEGQGTYGAGWDEDYR